MDTTVFDANVTSNNVLGIRAANSGWQGAADNGPFIFKVVPGDFQASVHITGYSILNYEFVGLLARAFSAADNASPNGPGFTENFIDWMRFDEFGISTAIFDTRNGANNETDNTDGETTDYWLLMSRVDGSNFYFFKKANLTDPWILTQTITRPDFTNGVPLQVGVEQSMFTGTHGLVQFDSFSLDATNISGGAPPSPTTGFTMTYNVNNNTMTMTWTPGTNSDGSVQTSFVVMRKDAPISAQPHFGELTGVSSVFGQGTDLGGGNYVVYRNTGNSVTVSGLTAGAVYYAAVYGYSGGGTTKSFNLAGGAGSGAVQAGVFTNISASLPGGIPLGGVGLPEVLGILNNGGAVNVASSSVITSGNTNVAVATNGVLTGLAIGSETNTVTFTSGTTVFTNYFVAVVHAPAYTDDFSATNNYLANGVAGTIWDGVYFGGTNNYPSNSIPGGAGGADGLTSVCDANITSSNLLTVASTLTDWAGTGDDGFFLFKNVPADFQTAVHVYSIDRNPTTGAGSVAYQFTGLMARRYGPGGSPSVIGTNAPAENWVYWGEFEQFADSTESRYALNGGDHELPNNDGATNDFWMLTVRSGDTFTFYRRVNPGDPWEPQPAQTIVQTNLAAGVPLQVGIFQALYSGNTGTAQFDSFMLDAQSLGPILQASGSSGDINVSWPAGWPGGPFTLQSTASLSPPANWQPVPGTPASAGGINTVMLPATNADMFFRLVH